MRKHRFIESFAIICLVIACIGLSICAALQIQKTVSTSLMEKQPQYVVLIDPGHGGEDGGTISSDGTMEKDINLAISLPLADMLRLFGYQVNMTRDSDCAIYDSDKTSIRNKKNSDLNNRLKLYNQSRLIIGIHQNHFTQSKYYGTQIFYGNKNAESKMLATSVRKTVLDLLQPENTRELKKATKDIYLLNNTTSTAIFVECGFLSNSAELAKLKNADYQQKMAYAITCGVLEYNP